MAHVIINEVCADVHPSRLDAALDLEILVTERYTGDYFLQEIKGLADSSGVDYKVTYNSVMHSLINEFLHILCSSRKYSVST